MYPRLPIRPFPFPGVEFLPCHRRAPSLDGLVVAAHAVRLRAHARYGFVGGHLGHGPRRRHRVLGVHAEPPRHRLDPVVDSHAPVPAEQLSQPGAHPLDAVVGRRNGPVLRQLGVEERGQAARAAQPLEGPPRPPEALALELGPAVDDGLLAEERVPFGAPSRERGEPAGRVVRVLDLRQLLRDGVQLDSRLEVRPGRRAPLHLAERVERASLHPRLRPMVAPRLLEPAAAVADRHVGRRDPRHEGSPRGRALAPREVPAHDVVGGAGRRHHACAAEPYAVDVDDVVDLVARRRRRRPYPPVPLGLAPERAPASRHRRLGRRREEPAQERFRAFCRRIDSARGGRAAGHALPSFRAGGRGPVAFRFAPAHGA